MSLAEIPIHGLCLTDLTCLRRNIRTVETGLNANQLWKLEAEPRQPGYYYIRSRDPQFVGFRIDKWMDGHYAICVEGKRFSKSQLWKFVLDGNGFYRFVGVHTSRRTCIAKDGKTWPSKRMSADSQTQ